LIEAPQRTDFQPRHRRSTATIAGVGGLVIGGDFQGLGIARSLGRRGVPVCIVDDELSISRYSRYATHAVRVKDLRDEQKTIEALLDVGKRLNLKGWVLYPTRDETVAALSRHKGALSEWFCVPTPHWDIIKWAWDKRNTYRLAERLGIPCPKTWFPQTVEDLHRIKASFPLILKPAIKEHFIYTAKAKAWQVNNPGELVAKFKEAAAFVPRGEMMVQDLIPGGSSEQQYGCGVFFIEGRAVGTMLAHYVRSHPPDFGRCSTFVETIDLPRLEELAVQFLEAIGYYGLAEVEFRRDPRDGEFKLLDVNARTWGYHTLGWSAGVDFPYMLFQHQIGQPVTPARARAGVNWVRWATDLPVGLHGFFLKRWGLAEYFKSIKNAHTEAVFDYRDPLPSVAEVALIPYLVLTRGY
jgi:predicted ATP-grasp superfamily ATP-dependent carboligase